MVRDLTCSVHICCSNFLTAVSLYLTSILCSVYFRIDCGASITSAASGQEKNVWQLVILCDKDLNISGNLRTSLLKKLNFI